MLLSIVIDFPTSMSLKVLSLVPANPGLESDWPSPSFVFVLPLFECTELLLISPSSKTNRAMLNHSLYSPIRILRKFLSNSSLSFTSSIDTKPNRLPPLLLFLAKQKACVTLQTLTLSKENAKAIESRGGISSLLDICQSGTPLSQAAAAAVLRNLTEFSDCRENFIEEHAVSVLLTLARSGTALAQEHSISCLSNLVKDDDDLKLLIVRKGGLISLKSFWDSASVKSLEVAVEFLSNLSSDQRLIEVIISNDFLIRLLNALNCGVLGVRTHAAEAVYKIGYNSKTRKELGELGFIPVLNRMLDGKSVEEIQAAAKALSTILVYTENRRVYRKDPRGVVSVVRLLDPSITNLDKKYPVSILNSLTHSKKCRKQMVKSGVLSHLEKLVAMDVEGAKSLQEAIGGGKLFGVFRIRS
ncbi:putative armadillo-like helical protein [Helianthus debilis subsp. tardiflorus]